MADRMSVGTFLRTTAARVRRDESGFSLVELLITLSLSTVVMVAVLNLLDSTAQQAPKDQERATAIVEAQSGLHRMTRELRQAYKVLDAGPKSMYVVIGRSTPPDIHVRYDCDIPYPGNTAYRRCVRWQAPVGQELRTDLPGQVVIDRGLSGVQFTYSPGPLNPTYVKVHIEVPQKGERLGGYKASFVLDDGFYLRNTDVLR
jgi:prepilin-type N-terminal cleavage/methylation domain-containing protein